MKQIVFLHSAPLWEEGEIPRIDNKAIAQARDRLQHSLKAAPEGVEVHIEVPSGRPIDNILKTSKSYKPDVILTGMPIRSLLQEKLFGSTTTGLAKACKTPVLILRPQLISTYTCEELELRCQHLFRYLLIPYDGSESSEYLIEKIKEYAQNRPDNSLEQCLLMWVVEQGGRRAVPKQYQVQDAQEKLEQVKTELEQLGLQVQAEVRLGEPYEELLDAALVFDISAIAVSSKSLGTLLEWPTASFAGELIRRSWHPVLFFPPPR